MFKIRYTGDKCLTRIQKLWECGLVRRWVVVRDKGRVSRTIRAKLEGDIRVVRIPERESHMLGQEGIRGLIRPGLVTAIISTNQGLLTKEECLKRGVGGRVLLVVLRK